MISLPCYPDTRGLYFGLDQIIILRTTQPPGIQPLIIIWDYTHHRHMYASRVSCTGYMNELRPDSPRLIYTHDICRWATRGELYGLPGNNYQDHPQKHVCQVRALFYSLYYHVFRRWAMRYRWTSSWSLRLVCVQHQATEIKGLHCLRFVMGLRYIGFHSGRR